MGEVVGVRQVVEMYSRCQAKVRINAREMKVAKAMRVRWWRRFIVMKR
jgi:hypothetical protein